MPGTRDTSSKSIFDPAGIESATIAPVSGTAQYRIVQAGNR
jgi:hypothetical protein